MIDEQVCNERHENINSALERIESKLDIVIRHDATNAIFWKVFGVLLTIASLIIASVKLFT